MIKKKYFGLILIALAIIIPSIPICVCGNINTEAGMVDEVKTATSTITIGPNYSHFVISEGTVQYLLNIEGPYWWVFNSATDTNNWLIAVRNLDIINPIGLFSVLDFNTGINEGDIFAVLLQLEIAFACQANGANCIWAKNWDTGNFEIICFMAPWGQPYLLQLFLLPRYVSNDGQVEIFTGVTSEVDNRGDGYYAPALVVQIIYQALVTVFTN